MALLQLRDDGQTQRVVAWRQRRVHATAHTEPGKGQRSVWQRHVSVAARRKTHAMADPPDFKPPSWASAPQHRVWLEVRRAADAPDSSPVATVRLDQGPHTTFGRVQDAVDVHVDDRRVKKAVPCRVCCPLRTSIGPRSLFLTSPSPPAQRRLPPARGCGASPERQGVPHRPGLHPGHPGGRAEAGQAPPTAAQRRLHPPLRL